MKCGDHRKNAPHIQKWDLLRSYTVICIEFGFVYIQFKLTELY